MKDEVLGFITKICFAWIFDFDFDVETDDGQTATSCHIIPHHAASAIV